MLCLIFRYTYQFTDMTFDPTQGYSANEYNILSSAQELKQDASVVLPFLNIAIHPYTVFVINKVLSRKFDTIENILEELKYVNNPEILDLIGVSLGENYTYDSLIEENLEGKREIKYLNEYITYLANILDDEDYL